MKKTEKIQKSFEFLRRMAEKQESFTVAELVAETGWTLETARTYLQKKLDEIVIAEGSHFRVNRSILGVRLDEYESLFKQKVTLFAKYKPYIYQDVTVYEFFLPLTREDVLQRALDELFYKDTVLARLKKIGLEHVKKVVEPKIGETEDAFLDWLYKFVGRKFGGYSISHVNGRFRADELLWRKEANHKNEEGTGYLIDETTAVVRFILPYKATEQIAKNDEEAGMLLPLQFDFVENIRDDVVEREMGIEKEARMTEWLFHHLFVKAVIRAAKQDEIWLLESGRRCRLFRYVSQDEE